MTFESIAFYLLGTVSVVSALLVVTRRNPVISVLCLILNFFCLAGLYLTLHAQFIAVIQIIVYAGAIMVLFLFVIMLLNLGDERRLVEGMNIKKTAAAGLTLGLLAEIVYILAGFAAGRSVTMSVQAANIGTVENIGSQLYTRFLFPFEITSLLLTAAIVGAIVLAKKKLK
ncbi:MAG TPA: NADH-quinone oxidoreductase subunit J [Bacteroidota bacterium]|nr:NADH-quinone oxidoreductase subunit J [Bacteroidota bacterium]